ncbi:MAG: tRNA (adenosine(37)-N6)-dimethylallyltransferase MiaA [Spirochaetales bacterium]|nr:tRNA (adenosine(37)-N6)-dimethylallyltransferase MiaA [Spirochaetales bacterium]
MNIVSKSKVKPPVIILFGPTASGKSHIIVNLLGKGCEVINADSQQVYKFLDIATAKPAKEDIDRIPHHLVGIIDPKRQFNAGRFVREAEKLVFHIFKKRKLPVLAGGTGFYLKNFIYGLPEAPPSSLPVRERLKQEAGKKGIACLFNKLMDCDPEYAASIEKNDLLRIIRALEVYEISGKPLSSFNVPVKERDDMIMYKIGLSLPREELYNRINNRVEEMFEKGLVDELRFLIHKGYTPSDPGMQGIGYQEFFLMQTGCFLFTDIKELIKQNTRRFAKRQITFFKSFQDVSWFHPADVKGIQSGIENFLKKYSPYSPYTADLFQKEGIK